MSSVGRLVVATLALTASAGGCVLVGYTFDGYGPADASGGAPPSSASASDATSGAGGAGGAGAGGAGGTGVTSSSTTSAGSGETDCTNGADDDGDTIIDCADPGCLAGHTCAPLPP